MDWIAFVWLGMMLLFLYMESATVTLVCIWFAAGSLAALIASLFHAPILVQGILFLAVSCLTLALLRPLFKKYVTPKIVKTNVDSIIGTTGLVSAPIDNVSAKGQVKLGAMEWTARSSSGEPISEGTLVRVDRIEGVKVFVSPA